MSTAEKATWQGEGLISVPSASFPGGVRGAAKSPRSDAGSTPINHAANFQSSLAIK